MLNYVFPLLNQINDWSTRLLHPLLMLLLWGALGASLSLAIYAKVSDQSTIKTLKRKSAGMRRRMLDLELDGGAYMRLVGQNLMTSLWLLAKVAGPSFLAGIPVIILIAWLQTFHAYHCPPIGSGVVVDHRPVAIELTARPAGSFVDEAGTLKMLVGAEETVVHIFESQTAIYSGNPISPPTRNLGQRKWWHHLMASEIGYLNPTARVTEIRWEFPRKRFARRGPAWMVTWEMPFFLSVLLVGLVLKRIYHIE